MFTANEKGRGNLDDISIRFRRWLVSGHRGIPYGPPVFPLTEKIGLALLVLC